MRQAVAPAVQSMNVEAITTAEAMTAMTVPGPRSVRPRRPASDDVRTTTRSLGRCPDVNGVGTSASARRPTGRGTIPGGAMPDGSRDCRRATGAKPAAATGGATRSQGAPAPLVPGAAAASGAALTVAGVGAAVPQSGQTTRSLAISPPHASHSRIRAVSTSAGSHLRDRPRGPRRPHPEPSESARTDAFLAKCEYSPYVAGAAIVLGTLPDWLDFHFARTASGVLAVIAIVV